MHNYLDNLTSSQHLCPHPQTKVIAHIKSSIHNTQELNVEVGWYIGPSMQYYICVLCYFPKTKSTRVCDTVAFLPKFITFPQINLIYFLKQAASKNVNVLSQPPSSSINFLQAGDSSRSALLKLATQLKRFKEIPQPVIPIIPKTTRTNFNA